MLKSDLFGYGSDRWVRTRHETSLTTRHMVAGLAIAAVMMALGVLSVYVRLLHNDLQYERRQLQARERELRVRLLQLEQDFVLAASPEEEREVARRELGLVEPSQEAVLHAALPPSVVKKYFHAPTETTDVGRGSVHPAVVAEEANTPPLLQALVGVVEASRAYARPNRD